MKFMITKQKIIDLVATMIRNYRIKRCECCGSTMIEYKEFSPDGRTYYFCNEKCFNKYKKWSWSQGVVYRASPLSRIKEEE